MSQKIPSKKKKNLSALNPPTNDLARFDRTRKQWKLKNGLRCIFVPLPKGDQRFHIGLMVDTGSRYEPKDKAGLSHLLEHMMFRGSALYPSFSDLSIAFESLGGEWNAATGHEYTEYFYSGTVDKANEACRLLSDFTLRPALKDLLTERRIVQRELEGELNEYGISTDVDFHILRTIWPETSMALPIIGSEETIKAIELEDLKAWLETYYHAKNFVLAVVGGTFTDAKRLAALYFADAPANEPREPARLDLPAFSGPKLEVIDNSDNEYEIQISFVCEGTNSPKTPAYDMLSRILGDGFSSRLVRRIREELGLLYDISVGFHQYDNGGTFNINASIVEANIEVFFSEFFRVLDDVTVHGPSADELKRHQTRALTDLMLVPSDPAHVAFRLSWAMITDADPGLDHWRLRVEEATAKKLKDTARELFDPKNLAVIALGPKDESIDKRFDKAVRAYCAASR